MDSQMLNRWGSDATGREDGMRIFSPDAHHVCVTIPMLQTEDSNLFVRENLDLLLWELPGNEESQVY